MVLFPLSKIDDPETIVSPETQKIKNRLRPVNT